MTELPDIYDNDFGFDSPSSEPQDGSLFSNQNKDNRRYTGLVLIKVNTSNLIHSLLSDGSNYVSSDAGQGTPLPEETINLSSLPQKEFYIGQC